MPTKGKPAFALCDDASACSDNQDISAKAMIVDRI